MDVASEPTVWVTIANRWPDSDQYDPVEIAFRHRPDDDFVNVGVTNQYAYLDGSLLRIWAIASETELEWRADGPKGL